MRTRQGRSEAAQGGEGKRSDTDADADAVCDKLKSGGGGPGPRLGFVLGSMMKLHDTRLRPAKRSVEWWRRCPGVAKWLLPFFLLSKQEPPTQQAGAGCRVVGAPRQVHDDPPTSLAPS